MACNTRDHYLRQTLFTFGDDESFLGADAVEGFLGIGATGVGKSTATARTVFRSLITAGYGGVFFTSKPDDLLMIASSYFEGTGRSPREDIVVVQPSELHPQSMWPHDLLGPPHKFSLNLLRYEFERGGHLTSNVVDLLHACTTSRDGAKGRDPFWDDALREIILHGIDLSVMGSVVRGGEADIRLDDVLDIITSAPVSFSDTQSDRFRGGRCYELLRTANEGRDKLSSPRFRDLQQTAHYWLNHFPGLAEETRSSIVATFTSKVTGLLRSPLRELFSGDSDPEAMPERSLFADPKTGQPKIIVINLPVKLYQGVGRFAQTLYKTVWQHAAERRIASIGTQESWRPAFMGADEAQYFITPNDASFQQTARSAMVATVYLTQNLPNLYAVMSEAETQSFLGNLQTKVFHAQGDPTTNDWAERVFGKELQSFLTDPVTGEGTPSNANSYSPVIPAIRFTELKKGGRSTDPSRNGRVGTYIFQAGRQWHTKGADKHYHEFEQ